MRACLFVFGGVGGLWCGVFGYFVVRLLGPVGHRGGLLACLLFSFRFFIACFCFFFRYRLALVPVFLIRSVYSLVVIVSDFE